MELLKMLTIRNEKTYYYLFMDKRGYTALKIFNKNQFIRYFNEIDKES